MNNKNKKLRESFSAVIVILFLVMAGSLALFSDPAGAQNVKVETSFYTLQEIVSRIGGEHIESDSIIPSGAEIHSYEPSPRDIARIENVDLFVYVGSGLEPWGERVEEMFKQNDITFLKVSDRMDMLPYREPDIDDFLIETEQDPDHEEEHNHDETGHNHSPDEDSIGDEDDAHHSHDHGHDHGAYDPHVWVDPLNYLEIARLVKEELIVLDPENTESYRENFQDVKDKITELDSKFSETLKEKESDLILVSHAAFSYLGERYGFKQLAVTGITPHEEPSPRTTHKLIQLAEERGINYIFRETLSSPRIVDVLAEEANLEILTLNPVAGFSEEELAAGENYFTAMEKNLENLKKALVD